MVCLWCLWSILQYELESPTIVVITDRNDLNNQLYSQFARCKGFLRQEPVQAESCEQDTEYDIMVQNADPDIIEKNKRELGQVEDVLGHDDIKISLFHAKEKSFL